ncbi:MAG: acetyltransferase [Flavobacteriales bacterium]|mgnify:CR=1 FL=1|jgi:sugar O-acyltransferase (sialic acid O-acetyltransferase NeuD family)|nr:acetyltransferase [Flavobacteriales bacterium]MBK7247043.1 acetyltransferase [Flavobacteriales bacterium]MBK7286935.1 acetyltransferase [Flavobacteriales bacterium]MBK9059435.1 acetyltransferase [Flavobacteriales bacterium]QQS73616.1 MAG: acetyltransferase [Flavobacteriales bacterium]
MIIAGAGGHAKELVDEWLKAGGSLDDIEFFDEVEPDRTLLGRPVKGRIQDWADKQDFILAVGSPALRRDLFERFKKAGHDPATLVSHSAQVSTLTNSLGSGLNIMALAVIGPNTQLANGVLVNSGAHIHHDAWIGEFTEISPRVSILGGVRIGSMARIGASATILPGMRIGDGAIVGAGAVVDRDVPPETLVVGIPARKIAR